MTTFDLSRKVPAGTPGPQRGRGEWDNLGPGNHRGPVGPRDNRPPSPMRRGSGRPPRRRRNPFFLAAVLAVLVGAGLALWSAGWGQ